MKELEVDLESAQNLVASMRSEYAEMRKRTTFVQMENQLLREMLSLQRPTA
jgi:regulator of replication initiation timing